MLLASYFKKREKDENIPHFKVCASHGRKAVGVYTKILETELSRTASMPPVPRIHRINIKAG